MARSPTACSLQSRRATRLVAALVAGMVWAGVPVAGRTRAVAQGGGHATLQAAYLDPRSEGAAEDGSTDDTAALQRAIERVGAPSAGGQPTGGTIWLARPASVCGLVVDRSSITFAGPNPEAAWFQPSRPDCPVMISVGRHDAPRGVTDVHFHSLGFVQPRPGTQVSGVMLAWNAATFSGIEDFFVRNAYDVFAFTNKASSIIITRGNIRTVAHDIAIIDGGNDHYFDHIISDYDSMGYGGAAGHGHACFEVKASDGSLVISNSDFIHCGIGLDVEPQGGAGVEWLFVDNTAFDTCTSDGMGEAIRLNPTGSDRAGHPSYIHGGKFINTWGSGCAHGLVTGSDKTGFTEAMAFDNLTVQGNSREGILLGGNVRAMSFVNLQAYRNSAGASGRYAQVRLAGTGGVGNASFVGGKIGDIADTPVHQADHTFSRGAASIDVDAGWNASLTVVGVDLCGADGRTTPIRFGDKQAQALQKQVSLVGNACGP